MNLTLLKNKQCWCLDTMATLQKGLKHFTDDWTNTPTESHITVEGAIVFKKRNDPQQGCLGSPVLLLFNGSKNIYIYTHTHIHTCLGPAATWKFTSHLITSFDELGSYLSTQIIPPITPSPVLTASHTGILPFLHFHSYQPHYFLESLIHYVGISSHKHGTLKQCDLVPPRLKLRLTWVLSARNRKLDSLVLLICSFFTRYMLQ